MIREPQVGAHGTALDIARQSCEFVRRGLLRERHGAFRKALESIRAEVEREFTARLQQRLTELAHRQRNRMGAN